MRPSAAISHFSRAVLRRIPQAKIATAATALIAAKKPLAVPFFEPPMPKRAPWLTRGITGALQVWRLEKPQSHSGASGSNWAINWNQPGMVSQTNELAD